MLKRICRLLLPDERKMGIRVVCAVFLCALLDFAGLAALLPVLFFLLDDGRDKDNSLYFGEKRFGSGAFTFSKPFSDVSLPSAQLFSLYFLLSTGIIVYTQQGEYPAGI